MKALQHAPAPHLGETAWYSGQQLPVQVGVYRRLGCDGSTVFSYFDGGHWLRNCRSQHQAARVADGDLSLSQALPWCGLVRPPAQGYGPGAVHTASGAAMAGHLSQTLPLPIVAEPAPWAMATGAAYV